MKFAISCGLAAGMAFALASTAQATVWHVDCPGGATATTLAQGAGTPQNFPADSVATNTSPDALGALLGTPGQGPETLTGLGLGFTANLSSGDVIEILGICTQDIQETRTGYALSIVNDSNSGSLVITDGIEGQLQIGGPAAITINGILLGNATATFSFPDGDTGTDNANLFMTGGAQVRLLNSQVSYGPGDGIFMIGASGIQIYNTTVSNNGFGGSTLVNSVMGIRASSGSQVQLGNPVPTTPDTVTITDNNGTGVAVQNAATLTIFSATISGNGAIAAGSDDAYQVEVTGGANAFITSTISSPNTTITSPSTSGAAIDVIASTLLMISGDQDCLTCSGTPTVIGNATWGAVNLGGSTIGLQGSVIEANSGANPVITLGNASSINFEGGNVISNCSGSNPCTPNTNGIAIEALRVATIDQRLPAEHGYPSLQDQIFGGAFIEMESTGEIGQGVLSGGGATPSLVWNTEGADIVIAQNSVFRMDGGATVTGTVELNQDGNAFFNHANGGTNAVTSVTCPFSNVPAAHVAGGTTVTPTVSLAPSIAAAIASGTGTCMAF